MNILSKTSALLGLFVVAGSPLIAINAPPNPGSLAPYFTAPAPGPKSPDKDGFIQRWMLLEPISKPLRTNAGFVDSFVLQELTREYFTGQFTLVPRHGDRVTVEGQELAWHALDATGFNVKLFRFASRLEKRIYGVVLRLP